MPPCDSHKGPQTAFRNSSEQSPVRHAEISVPSLQKHITSVVPVGSHWQVVVLKVWPGSRQVLETHLPPHITCPDGHAAAQWPSVQVPLQHCSSSLHRFPAPFHPGGSAAASPMPSDASVPPTRAAPISLSALPREMLPLASPLVSSSKECSLATGDIAPLLSQRGGTRQPRRVI